MTDNQIVIQGEYDEQRSSYKFTRYVSCLECDIPDGRNAVMVSQISLNRQTNNEWIAKVRTHLGDGITVMSPAINTSIAKRCFGQVRVAVYG